MSVFVSKSGSYTYTYLHVGALSSWYPYAFHGHVFRIGIRGNLSCKYAESLGFRSSHFPFQK